MKYEYQQIIYPKQVLIQVGNQCKLNYLYRVPTKLFIVDCIRLYRYYPSNFAVCYMTQKTQSFN